MAKRIKIGNDYFRVRRGKLIKIPDDWVGKVTHPQTIRKRKSKETFKSNKVGKVKGSGYV